MTNRCAKHIIVGLSGGVDSAVTAYLLKKAGYYVEAIFMKNWESDDADSYCPAAIDIADAQSVCDKLKIKLDIVNFADQYWERVFSYFLQHFAAARTPNPDVLCNKEIKFRAFLDYAKQRGADYIATGHYARIYKTEKSIYLAKGTDTDKDQSYFLHLLTQQQLALSLFPLGDMYKTEVRKIASEIGLKNHAKKDSTGICFIGERKFKTFLQDYLPAKTGLIKTLEGEVIGQHEGVMFYTIGQRHGLQIGGQKGKNDQPWYVASKDILHNILYVVQSEHHASLYKNELFVSKLHWINRPPTFPFKTFAKTRYRQSDQACTVAKTDKKEDHVFRVLFKAPQRALAPGQSIVFYQDEICLGGGIID